MQVDREFWRCLWGRTRVTVFLIRKTFGPMLLFRTPAPWISEIWRGNPVLGCQGQIVYIGAFLIQPLDSWPFRVSTRIEFYTHPCLRDHLDAERSSSSSSSQTESVPETESH